MGAFEIYRTFFLGLLYSLHCYSLALMFQAEFQVYMYMYMKLSMIQVVLLELHVYYVCVELAQLNVLNTLKND